MRGPFANVTKKEVKHKKDEDKYEPIWPHFSFLFHLGLETAKQKRVNIYVNYIIF